MGRRAFAAVSEGVDVEESCVGRAWKPYIRWTSGQIPIRFVDVELEDTLEIAAQFSIHAYDAYLIRCALKFSAPLLSLDQGLLQTAQRAGARVAEVE